MRLVDEYIERHKLKVPLVHFVEQQGGTLLIRQEKQNSINYQLAILSLRNDQSHPLKYTVRIMKPIRNAHQNNNRNAFEAVHSEELEWDEYEEWLYTFVKSKNDGSRVVRDNQEVTMTMWEIFCYCYDGTLTCYVNNELFFKSLDSLLPLYERHAAYSSFIGTLKIQQPTISEIWHKEMLQYIRIYCFWVAKMDGIEIGK